MLAPKDLQYLKYDNNITFSALKIADVYQSLCVARANLHFLDNKDFGDYAKDEISIRFVKSMHIQNSLIYYNIAVDYSWQVIWLYYNKELNGKKPTHQLYENAIKDCTFDELLLGLTLVRDIKMRDYIVRPFFQKNKYYLSIRPQYNYLKHRGTYYIEGLGENRSTMMFAFERNGEKVDLSMVSRKELDTEATKQSLIEFDKAFVQYMNTLIQLLIPKNFVSGKTTFKDMLEAIINYYPEA